MDFLDPKKKKAHKIRLFVGYFLMAIAIGIGAFVLLYAAYGYSVDRSGNVFQNSLVFLASTPDSAEANITDIRAGSTQRATTSTRLVLPAGEYSFELLKEGYRPWSRTIMLGGGQVERLLYPFLFPDDLVISDRQLYAVPPELSTVSPDRHWIIVQSPTQFNVFDVFDANNPQTIARPIVVPAHLFTPTAQQQKLELVEWSTNNRHVLLRYIFDGQTEFILLDRESPQNSININKHMGVNPVTATLRDKHFERLYLLMPDGQLFRANTRTQTTDLLLQNVVTFWPHGSDTVAYISNRDTTETKQVSVNILEADQNYEIRTLPQSEGYLIDLARYNDRWYLAVGAATSDRIFVYRDPVEAIRSRGTSSLSTTRTLRLDNPQKLSFSNNAQFISVQSGQHFVVYDAETDLQHRYTIEEPFDNAVPAIWMDGHRLTGVTKGKILVFDFNGINQQVLSPALPLTNAMFDRDYTGLYTVAPSVNVTGRYALTRTELRVENN